MFIALLKLVPFVNVPVVIVLGASRIVIGQRIKQREFAPGLVP